MKFISYSLLLIATLAACSTTKDADDPRIELTDLGFALHLPPAMQQAIDSLAPGFRPVRASSFRSDVSQAAASQGSGGLPAAFAAVGDFDHDGSVDAVVEGAAPGDTGLRVIAILNGATPVAEDVTRFPVYDADAVGIYLANPPAGAAGAFEVVAYPDSTVLYKYENGAFERERVGT